MRPGGTNGYGSRSNALWGRGGRRVTAIVATVTTALALAATAAAGTAGGGRHASGASTPRASAGRTRTSRIRSPARSGRTRGRSSTSSSRASRSRRTAARPASASAGLRSGLLGTQRGANTIGSSQIRRSYRSIDGLHASLTGLQIAFMAKLPYVAAIVPNDTVKMSSSGSQLAFSSDQQWTWAVGAAADWTSEATSAADADDRDRRLRRRRDARRLRRAACSARST